MDFNQYIELIILARDSGGFNGMNFMAVFFAYIAANHFVGKDLTRMQLAALTFAYTLWSFMAIFGVYLAADLAITLTSELHREHPSAISPYATIKSSGGAFLRFVVVGLLFFAWAMSVNYAFRKKAEHDDS